MRNTKGLGNKSINKFKNELKERIESYSKVLEEIANKRFGDNVLRGFHYRKDLKVLCELYDRAKSNYEDMKIWEEKGNKKFAEDSKNDYEVAYKRYLNQKQEVLKGYKEISEEEIGEDIKKSYDGYKGN